MARRGIDKPLETFVDHALADDWRDFAHASVVDHLSVRRGLVYVVGNPVHQGLYKVGSTASLTVDARLKSLRTAGVVGEFHEIESFIAFDRFGAEALAHQALEQCSQRHKEFFVIDSQAAVDAVHRCVRGDNAALRKAFIWLDDVA